MEVLICSYSIYGQYCIRSYISCKSILFLLTLFQHIDKKYHLRKISVVAGYLHTLKAIFIAQAKVPAKKNLHIKICQKGNKTQKKCIKISKIRLKEVSFTVSRSKARICAGCGKFCADVRLCVCRFQKLWVPSMDVIQGCRDTCSLLILLLVLFILTRKCSYKYITNCRYCSSE